MLIKSSERRQRRPSVYALSWTSDVFEVEVNGKLEIGILAVFFPAKKKPSPLSANSVRVSGQILTRERSHLERKTVGSPSHPVHLVL